jgi:hypothetical protein
MSRWLLKLKGEVADLEEFPHWFPAGDPRAFKEGADFYLESPRLNVLSSSRSVQEVGRAILEEAAAVVSLMWPALVAPTIEHMICEADDGTRTTHYTLHVVGATHRFKSGKRVGAPLKAGKTDAQWFHTVVQSSSSLRTALLLWADPARTWPRLYRVLEEVETFLQQDADKAGLCSAAERKRFTHSANAASVAGKDARHADGVFASPKNPMTLAEATSFVRGVIHACLTEEALRRHCQASSSLTQGR